MDRDLGMIWEELGEIRKHNQDTLCDNFSLKKEKRYKTIKDSKNLEISH